MNSFTDTEHKSKRNSFDFNFFSVLTSISHIHIFLNSDMTSPLLFARSLFHPSIYQAVILLKGDSQDKAHQGSPFPFCNLSFRSRQYRGGASQTPHSIPFVTFYELYGFQW